MAKPEFECSACGSRRVELRDLPADAGMVEKLLNMVKPAQFTGRKYLVCKDCGHTEMISIL